MSPLKEKMLGAFTFAAGLIVGVWAMCSVGVAHCRFGTDLRFSEVIVPIAAASFTVLMFGLLLAIACQFYLTASAAPTKCGAFIIGYFLFAALVASLPLLAWDGITRIVSTGTVLGNVNALYVPLTIGGLSCAATMWRVFLRVN